MFKSSKLDSKAFVYGEINRNEKSTSNESKEKFKIKRNRFINRINKWRLSNYSFVLT